VTNRVVIADDHAPTRAAVRAALEHGGFEVAGEAATAAAAVALVTELRPEVCLLDINMPGNGIAAVAHIAERNPNVAIVMLTVSSNDDDVFAAIRAGAGGYLLKGMDPSRLPDALRAVLAGEGVLPGS
jgi:DNA-binding NarL/FixJ family response regulator